MSARHIARTEAEALELGIASCRLSVLASLEWLRRECAKHPEPMVRATANDLYRALLHADSAIDNAAIELRNAQ